MNFTFESISPFRGFFFFYLFKIRDPKAHFEFPFQETVL
jgi:hypothetical protein